MISIYKGYQYKTDIFWFMIVENI